MLIRRIRNTTHVIGAPKDWPEGSPCASLPVRAEKTAQGTYMVSSWEPTAEELERLNNGASIQLWVRGTKHPVVNLKVES